MRSLLSKQFGIYSLVLGCASCTVYLPMQAYVPQVQRRGQVEAGANVELSTRMEAKAAYSPANHFLLTGAGSVALPHKYNTYLSAQLVEAGMGGYWNIRHAWTLSALLGGGYATVNRQFCFLGCDRYQGTYYKRYGQLGLFSPVDKFVGGSLSYRLVSTDYRNLQFNQYALKDFQTWRHELYGVVGVNLSSTGAWQAQFGGGTSVSVLSPPREGDNNQETSKRWFATGLPAFSVNIGVVWHPH